MAGRMTRPSDSRQPPEGLRPERAQGAARQSGARKRNRPTDEAIMTLPLPLTKGRSFEVMA